MPTKERAVRQSVTLPTEVVQQVRGLARAGHTSASRVIAELIDRGLEAKTEEKRRFLDLADKLARTKNASEQARIKEELARLTFGS